MINSYRYTQLLLIFLMGSIHSIQASDEGIGGKLFDTSQGDIGNTYFFSKLNNQSTRTLGNDNEEDNSNDGDLQIFEARSISTADNYSCYQGSENFQHFDATPFANNFSPLFAQEDLESSHSLMNTTTQDTPGMRDTNQGNQLEDARRELKEDQAPKEKSLDTGSQLGLIIALVITASTLVFFMDAKRKNEKILGIKR